MYCRDRELCLQFYREDFADDELYARPAPIDVLAEAVHKLITRLGRHLALAMRGAAELLAPR